MELSFSEIVVVCVIAFLVFGPQEFIRKTQQMGRFLGKMRTQANNFKVMAQEQIMKADQVQEKAMKEFKKAEYRVIDNPDDEDGKAKP